LTTRPVTPNYTGRVGVFAVRVQGTLRVRLDSLVLQRWLQDSDWHATKFRLG